MKKAFSLILYSLGTLIMLGLTVLILLKVEGTPSETSMIPLETWEGAMILLGIGTVPIWVVTMFFLYAWELEYKALWIRILVLIPAIVCSIFALYWIGVFLIGIFNDVKTSFKL